MRRRPRVVFVARIASSAVRLAVARAFVASDRTDASNAANASSRAEPEPTPPSKRVPSGEAKENAADARNAFFFPAGSAAHHAETSASASFVAIVALARFLVVVIDRKRCLRQKLSAQRVEGGFSRAPLRGA